MRAAFGSDFSFLTALPERIGTGLRKTERKETKMKNITKSLLALLLCGCLLPAAAACKKDQPPVVSGNTSGTDTEPGIPPVETDENGYELDDLPNNPAFDKTVRMLYWDDVENVEFEVSDPYGDRVSNSIYMRNLAVEERLGIKLSFHGTGGNYGNLDNFLATAQAGSISGDYDLFAGYSMSGASLAINGLCLDLKTQKYLNFEKPWWPESLTSETTIIDKLFFTSGDISTNLLHMMYVVFYNQEMIDAGDLEDPVELVDEGKWTYEKMFDMARGMYLDNNSNEIADPDDRYGFSAGKMHYEALFTGAGIRTIEKNSLGWMIVSPTFNSAKTTKLLDDICSFVHGSDDGFYGTTFEKGRTLFAIDRSYFAMIHKEEMSFTYGIVPIPKYDELQEGYATCLGNPFTVYSIAKSGAIPDVAAATLECLASEGYRKVTPELFEAIMKHRYSEVPASARMFDLIRGSVIIDLGRIFDKELGGYPHTLFSNPIAKNAPESFSSSYKTGAETMLERLKNSINPAFSK